MLPRYCTTSNLELYHFRKKEKSCCSRSDPDDVFTVARLLGQSCRHHCRSLHPLHNLAASTRHQVGCHLASTSNPSATQQVRGWEVEGEFSRRRRRGDVNGGEVCVRVQSHTLVWIHHGKVILLWSEYHLLCAGRWCWTDGGLSSCAQLCGRTWMCWNMVQEALQHFSGKSVPVLGCFY